MRIPEHKVDEIYQALDIVDIVSDYLPLKKKGQTYWALSPFTTEKTPSFAVSPAKNIYKCFSSGNGGNGVNFVMEMEGYSYVEALVHLAKKYSIAVEVEENSEDAELIRDKKQSLFIVNEFAGEFFHKQLLESDSGRSIGLSYFKERGLLESTIEKFQLGYSQDEWEHFSKAALNKKYKEEFLVELGLSTKSEKRGNLIDRFRGRIMFPITNTVGKIVGFGGRTLSKEKKVAKYINSPESPIYHKSKVLFGLSHARQHIRNQDQCIITEGYMDTVVMHQYGIQNVVASSGTALAKDQIRLLRRFTKNILMIYDGDAAGIKASMRAIDLLVEESMAPKLLMLPNNHDPDSYIQEVGLTGFQEYIASDALDYMDFKLKILDTPEKHNDPTHKAELVRQLSETLARIPDRIQKEVYVSHLSEKLGISEALLAQAVFEAGKEFHKLQQRELKREGQNQKPEVKELNAFEQLELAKQEYELLRILLNYFDKSFPERERKYLESEEVEIEEISLVEFFQIELEGLQFENQIFEQLKNEILATADTEKGFNINKYLNHEDQAICNLVSKLLTITHVISENWRKFDMLAEGLDSNLGRTVRAAIYHYKYAKVKKLLREAREKLSSEKEEEKLNKVLKVFVHLNGLKDQLAQRLGIVIDTG